jgi:hypothetical protein
LEVGALIPKALALFYKKKARKGEPPPPYLSISFIFDM